MVGRGCFGHELHDWDILSLGYVHFRDLACSRIGTRVRTTMPDLDLLASREEILPVGIDSKFTLKIDCQRSEQGSAGLRVSPR
jgi:hypothetical protein